MIENSHKESLFFLNIFFHILTILGIHPLQHGDPSAAPTTYKGTVAIDEYAQRRIKSKLDDIDEALNRIS